MILPVTRGRITENYPMANLSWLRVGGIADYLFQPQDAEDLAAFLRELPLDIPVFPVGMCSNLIIRDGGIRGVVIRLGRGFKGIDISLDGGIVAGAGALDAHVAHRGAQAGVDVSFLRTIPGAIGGALAMNAGCYGRYMADIVVSVSGVTRGGDIMDIPAADLGLAYRSSALPDGFIVTSVCMRAPLGKPEDIEITLQHALEHRAKTQPTKELSCGSTFRNPAGFSSTGRADDQHHLKAWKLIDNAGMRGAVLGGAQISEMHSNFMINRGDASAHDLEQLGELVRKKVFHNSEILLEWEIMRVGEPE